MVLPQRLWVNSYEYYVIIVNKLKQVFNSNIELNTLLINSYAPVSNILNNISANGNNKTVSLYI